LPVVDGVLHPVGAVVVFAIPEELPVALPYAPEALDTSDGRGEETLNGPLLVAVLAV